MAKWGLPHDGLEKVLRDELKRLKARLEGTMDEKTLEIERAEEVRAYQKLARALDPGGAL